MPVYQYSAVNRAGKTVKGVLTAQDMEQLKSLLRRDNLVLIEAGEQNVMQRDIDLSFLTRVKPRDLSVFCRQFVSIVGAGIPAAAALGLLASQTQCKPLRTAILETQLSIEKGESLSGSMRMHKRVFPEIMCNMVEAGEASGNLEIAFSRMAEFFEKDARTRGAVKKAMAYPIIVLIVMVLVLIVLMVGVIPNFQSMFDDMDQEMPFLTQIVIDVSNFVAGNLPLILLVMVALGVGIYFFGKTDPGRHVSGWLARKLPLFGSLTVKSASSSFARTFSTLMASGLPMLDALEITAKNMTNVYFEEALMQARSDVAAGTPLALPLEASGIFPPMVYHMTSIGEETGELEAMLTKMADYYDEEVESATAALTSAIEPLIMVFLAGIVLVVVLAIYLPMFTMYDGFL